MSKTMDIRKKLLCIIGCTAMALASPALAQAAPGPAARDGSHDMDFNIGTWHTDISRYPDPFARPNDMYKMAGTVTVRPVWNGKAELEEIEADGPSGHWQGATLFLYDPQARQWSQNFVDSASGRFEEAPDIGGEYRDGKIEYFSTDTVAGRTVLSRGIWSDIKPDSHSYEIDFSADGGRSWHTKFIAHLTRIGAGG